MKNVIEKFQNMKPSQVIGLMLEVIQNPIIPLDFDYFYKQKTLKYCVGCAATNAILYQMPKYKRIKILRLLKTYSSDDTSIALTDACTEYLDISYKSLRLIEDGINYLRLGDVDNYNYYASRAEMKTIPEKFLKKLPRLENNYPQSYLNRYIKYKAKLEKLGY